MKIHYYLSESPSFVGPIVTLCLTEIRTPQIACMWDEQRMGEKAEFNSLRDCRQCVDIYRDMAEREMGLRYVFGVVSGEEALSLRAQQELQMVG